KRGISDPLRPRTNPARKKRIAQKGSLRVTGGHFRVFSAFPQVSAPREKNDLPNLGHQRHQGHHTKKKNCPIWLTKVTKVTTRKKRFAQSGSPSSPRSPRQKKRIARTGPPRLTPGHFQPTSYHFILHPSYFILSFAL